MEVSAYPATSMVANLNDLENFVLRDPEACALYKQFLGTLSLHGRKEHHIDFFVDFSKMEEKEWAMLQVTKSRSSTQDHYKRELEHMHEKYFLDGPWQLDISQELKDKVRDNLQIRINLLAFKPAIQMVVRDLVFVHFESFIQSPAFNEFKETAKEKHRVLPVYLFDEARNPAWRRQSMDQQPVHTKQYKLSKRFGERVGVERTSLLADIEGEDPAEAEAAIARRDRRLHVFFGDFFEVDDVLFSERLRGQESTAADCQKQPTHVNNFRLARFFGEMPPKKNEQGELSEGPDPNNPRCSKTRHLNKFFGERIDPQKESGAVSYATQAPNVRVYKLKQIFGESASHSISFGGTWPRSRAKLEKLLGPFVN